MLYHPNLLAYYRFEDNDNPSTGGSGIGKDDSGNGHHGTVYGVSAVDGKIGGGASFDGVNDTIVDNYGVRNALIGKRYITVSMFVKPTAAKARAGLINIASTATAGAGFYLEIVNNADFRVLARSKSTDPAQIGVWTYSFTNNVWYNIVAAIDYSNNLIYAWINSVPLTPSSVSFGSPYFDFTGNQYTTIGALGGTTFLFEGVMDSIQIYDALLLETDIRRVMIGLNPVSI